MHRDGGIALTHIARAPQQRAQLVHLRRRVLMHLLDVLEHLRVLRGERGLAMRLRAAHRQHRDQRCRYSCSYGLGFHGARRVR